jgi:3-methyladenine DNA glycosylase Mpg
MIPEPNYEDREWDLEDWYEYLFAQSLELRNTFVSPNGLTKAALIRAVYAERKLAELQQDQITRSGYEDLHE